MSYGLTLNSSLGRIRVDFEGPNDTYNSCFVLTETHTFETGQAIAMAGDNSARSLLQKLIHAASTPYFGILERYLTVAQTLHSSGFMNLRMLLLFCTCYMSYQCILFPKRK